MSAQYRQEYPRPQFERDTWLNLNGEWEFEFDDDSIGEKERWYESSRPFSRKIQVPFCFQSKLSGIGITDFHDVVWYRRKIQIPEEFKGKRIILHFGAVDYIAKVWVNGRMVKYHEGGHTPFCADITDVIEDSEAVIVLRAEDFSEDMSIPRGKQYWKEKSAGIFYTRTTGIWQTVWIEAVNETYLERVKFNPDIDACEIKIDTSVKGYNPGKEVSLQVEISFNGETFVKDTYAVGSPAETRTIRLRGRNGQNMSYYWTPERPHLFDVQFTLLVDGQEVDSVKSYFGMRKISVENGKVMLNNRPYFMKMVLDQGYFPDGVLTAPTDEALKNDVEITKAMGFNGARKHQKVEDPRYLYWCDKLGLLVWGEMANAYVYTDEYVRRITREWMEVIERDYNHPCIVAWVPINESWGVGDILNDKLQQSHALAMYHLTKSFDSTRLVISNDGWEHVKSDLCTIHDYEWRYGVLAERYSEVEKALASAPAGKFIFANGYKYEGQPILVTEFGGIAFKKSDWEGWGYSGAQDEEDFLKRLKDVVQPLTESGVVQGFCYTQLTDVEQEINGLVTYDRVPKVPLEKIREIIGG